MKVTVLVLVLAVLLGGCALAPDEYRSVTAHAGAVSQSVPADAVTVRTYEQLKQAVLDLVERRSEEGTIRAANYEGDLEADLAQATYEVAKLEPLGAYAVDYMTHDSTLIVNYYEIHIQITFRRTAREIASVESVTTQAKLRARVEQAVANLESHVAMRVSGYRERDLAAIVEEYCDANPATAMEVPQVSVSVYPDSGSVRIVELELKWSLPPETLRSYTSEVAESVHNAAEYIRYRQSDREKLELLFTYLTERFQYEAAETATPVHDALCAGVADPTGLARAWKLICDEAGVECYTVEGLYNGEARMWNVVGWDGGYRHVDLARSILEGNSLRPYTDLEMTAYYWNPEQAPACIVIQEPEEEAPETGEETPEEPAEEEPQEPEEAETPADETGEETQTP